MFIRFLRIFYYVALISGLCFSGPAVGQDSAIGGYVGLSDLIKDITRAISEARLVDNKEPYFIIKEVELHLKGSWTVGGEGKFTIPVWIIDVSAEAAVTSIKTEELALVLIPSDSAPVGGDSLIELTGLIRTIKESFAATRSEGITAKSIDFTREWIFQRNADANVETVVMKLGAGISDEKAQSITFRLCQTEDLETCVGDE